MTIHQWIVTSEFHGERIDKALPQALKSLLPEESLSRNQIQTLLKEEKILLNGQTLSKNIHLKTGDIIEIRIDPPSEIDLAPVNEPLEILYEDKHIAFINKPAGLSVHPSETDHGTTLVHLLLYHIKDLSGIGGKLRPGIVHRLDKFTSGVMVVSKSNEAHQKLVEAFKDHSHHRTYHALCYGAPLQWGQQQKKIETKIGRDPGNRKKMSSTVKDGKDAISLFRCLEKYSSHRSEFDSFGSLIEANLVTGRTHQVRVHLNSLNHSLMGDPLYGVPSSQQPKWRGLPDSVKEKVTALPGQALHATFLGMNHPITGERLEFHATPPPSFQNLLNTLREFKK